MYDKMDTITIHDSVCANHEKKIIIFITKCMYALKHSWSYKQKALAEFPHTFKRG